jgi:hypothetical protein
VWSRLISFKGNFNLGTLLEPHVIAVSAGDGVFDADFTTHFIGPINCELRQFRVALHLDNFLNRSAQNHTRLVSHSIVPFELKKIKGKPGKAPFSSVSKFPKKKRRISVRVWFYILPFILDPAKPSLQNPKSGRLFKTAHSTIPKLRPALCLPQPQPLPALLKSRATCGENSKL